MEATVSFLAPYLTLEGFTSGFTASFFMILATEVGDRTFFIAAIMAMRCPRSIVWASAVGALFLMTFISCVFGLTAIAFIPKIYVQWTVILLMFFFGGQLLKNGLSMSKEEAGFDEMHEVEAQTIKVDKDEESKKANSLRVIALQAFTLTFLAEWGDRSQLATIALAAAHSPVGVMAGGCLGHALCTGIAVIGGRLIANYVSERTVNIFGGLLFMLFGIYGVSSYYYEFAV
eukprot:TRINITY_DN17304_c0_g1_i1.p1 TRINITY_DN17304_c0_g1~~TRINITY_DN17304_c0_g1_i1.p1  ORF type:complete len:231 (-),score=29.21 TRINITY_DN17304_c0_g1_i1:111-803(-)